MYYANTLIGLMDNISERLRVIDALKEGAADPFAKYELVVEEGVYLKVMMMLRDAQKTAKGMSDVSA